MASLEIRCSRSPARHQELAKAETTIGRRSDCDVVLLGDTVSRRHARLLEEDGRFFIEDLGSAHGSFVNDERIGERRLLRDGDRIRIAETIMTFEAGVAPQRKTESTILSALDGRADVDALGTAEPREKLRALLDLTGSLGSTLDLDEVFPKILESAFRIFPHAGRGSIWLVDPDDDELVPRAAHDRNGASCSTPPLSSTIADRVIHGGEAVLSADTQDDRRFEESQSIVLQDIRSVMCAPLVVSSGHTVGMIQLDSGTITHSFTSEDLDVLVNLANLAGQVVAHAQLHESRLDYERQQRDLSLARNVQAQFLPEHPPQIDGYDIAHHYRPAASVGGDYFDYVELPDGRLALVLGDVAGKGVSAALLMARLCSDVRSLLLSSPTVVDAVQAINRRVYSHAVFGRFVTFALCVLEPSSGEVVLVNAGHIPPLHRDGEGRVQAVGEEAAGPPLGVLEDASYAEAPVCLASGDALLLSTDGVSEAKSADGRMLGEAAPVEVMRAESTATDIVAALVARVLAHSAGTPANDDLCTIALSRDANTR